MSKQRVETCCQLERGKTESAPDHTPEMHRTNRIAGQIAGVKRMIENREYCPKILIQIQAIRAALKSLETSILDRHLRSCVLDAFTSMNEKEKANKLDELMELFKRS
jgi:DNA-binding FrmR family transcriptional regulator